MLTPLRNWLVLGMKARFPRAFDRLRVMLGRGRKDALHSTNDDAVYHAWLKEHVVRRKAWRRAVRSGQFSILTTVYNTPAHLLNEAANSIFKQTARAFEWVVLDNGSQQSESAAVCRRLSSDRRVRYFRVETNLGIMNGMKLCLEHATGEYVVPFDSDDLLFPDALELLASKIEEETARGCAPGMIYSDEDMLVRGFPQSPYLRPDWDPALNLCSSYVWHLCAIRRERALALGVYSDPGANWCHDWDTVFRFQNAGEKIVHLPVILYHWRQHLQSSTNRPDPESESMVSQKHLLMRQIARQTKPENFEVVHSPIVRGAPEWWVRRRHTDPGPLDLVLRAKLEGNPAAWLERVLVESEYPFRRVVVTGCAPFVPKKQAELTKLLEANRAKFGVSSAVGDGIQALVSTDGLTDLKNALSEDGWTVVAWEQIVPEKNEWPWEALGLSVLHSDVAMIAARIVNPQRVVLGGSEILGFGGLIGCPDYARPEHDHGYWCMATKTRSVSAPHPAFFVAQTAFLKQTLECLPACATISMLGAWLGASARLAGRRTIFSAIVTAQADAGFELPRTPGPGEADEFIRCYGVFLPDCRFYSRHLGTEQATAFQLLPAQ